jgi:DNA-binding response OmpR family regulator
MENTKNKILVVDDELVICNLLKDFLTDKGYEVVYANTGKDGLELLKTFNPDVMLLDIELPDMKGLDVLLRSRPIKKDLKVLILTGHGTIETAIGAMQLGAYDHLSKPFELISLEEKIRKLILNV